ncbi:E3 ubiquitin-protein ligase TRIM35-like [Latimeria chalumnae]|uniref:E3 ubiquitin-protein ligase TRIM35-like n=1 Tax=Latimeria chalumnae TaxID=7897 RepID=UPI00313F39FC
MWHCIASLSVRNHWKLDREKCLEREVQAPPSGGPEPAGILTLTVKTALGLRCEHEEKLKLYCLEDQEAICVVCQTSRKHENHKFLPIKEAAEEFKEELKNSLKPFQDTHQKIAELKEKYRGNLNNIHDQAGKTEKQIKEDFVKLHQFLHKEEKSLLADLKKEEEEKAQKMRAMEKSIAQDLTSVSKIIKDIQQKMEEEDQIFLMTLRDMRERIKKYADYKPREPEAVSAVDIDGYKYTGCLLYRVLKKMLKKFINPVTVTLDPNTAHTVGGSDRCNMGIYKDKGSTGQSGEV